MFYAGKLSEEAREFLRSRGITDTSIEEYGIGYGDGEGLREHLIEKCGFTEDECVEVGSIEKRQEKCSGDLQGLHRVSLFPVGRCAVHDGEKTERRRAKIPKPARRKRSALQ